jgi:pilus assembly protein CpaC
MKNMKRNHALYICATIAIAVGMFLTTMTPVAFASKSNILSMNSGDEYQLYIRQGMAEIIDIEEDISDLMIANPSLIDVTVLQSKKIYIVGTALGSTNILAIDKDGNVIKRINVRVKIDDQAVEMLVKDLFPEEDVKISTVADQVVITGTVASPDVAQSIASIVTRSISQMQGSTSTDTDSTISNLLRVRGKSQITLRMRVMEISRVVLREIGVTTTLDDIGTNAGGDLVNSRQLGGLFGGAVETGLTQTPFAAFGLNASLGAFGPIDSAITLLEDEGLAKILAEPNLTAVSGEQATFLAGGEFPVPTSRDSDGNIVITFRRFGVAVTFLPTILSDNRINLQLETEVSSLARENQVQLAGLEVPGLDVRRASTTVELGSGGTLMIAGLLQSQAINNMSGLPGLKDTPILGDLFSSESFRREETELVIMVTPYTVQPFSDKNQADHRKLPEPDTNYLQKSFAYNMRRIYGTNNPYWSDKMTDILAEDGKYGYILH